jgi:hypothetical protein
MSKRKINVSIYVPRKSQQEPTESQQIARSYNQAIFLLKGARAAISYVNRLQRYSSSIRELADSIDARISILIDELKEHRDYLLTKLILSAAAKKEKEDNEHY